MTRILVSAGDASGDLCAAELVEALRPRLPDLRVVGLGGEALAAAGAELRVPLRAVAIGGLVEVLRFVPRVLEAFRTLEAAAREAPTALAVLVDAPDLNLRLARRLRRTGVPILYYVTPQVWAWRSGRLRTLARLASRVAVIFPFEADLWSRAGVRADFVGHPLVDRLRAVRARADRAGVRPALGLPGDAPLVALLPGSRGNEVGRNLPLYLAAAEALVRRVPRARFVLPLATTVSRADVAAPLAAARARGGPEVAVREGGGPEVLVAADVALVKPGTGTLEAAVLGCPLVAAGRANALTAGIIRRWVRVPSLTLPNLIAGAPVVPELLQEDAVPDRIAAALEELLGGPARALQLARLDGVARALGDGGAAGRAAAIALEMIGARVA